MKGGKRKHFFFLFKCEIITNTRQIIIFFRLCRHCLAGFTLMRVFSPTHHPNPFPQHRLFLFLFSCFSFAHRTDAPPRTGQQRHRSLLTKANSRRPSDLFPLHCSSLMVDWTWWGICVCSSSAPLTQPEKKSRFCLARCVSCRPFCGIENLPACVRRPWGSRRFIPPIP